MMRQPNLTISMRVRATTDARLDLTHVMYAVPIKFFLKYMINADAQTPPLILMKGRRTIGGTLGDA